MSGQAQPELSEAYKAENKGPTTIAVCWAVSTLSTVFVLARVYTRARILNQLRSDDYFMIISQVCSYISTALSTVAVAYGNGKHMDTLTQSQQEGAILWTTAAFCPGIMSFGFPKLGVIILLIRLLNPGRAHRYFLWALGIWCQLTLFATVGVLLGRCRPARSLWNFDIKGECFDTQILVAYCIYAGCTYMQFSVAEAKPLLTAGSVLGVCRPVSCRLSHHCSVQASAGCEEEDCPVLRTWHRIYVSC